MSDHIIHTIVFTLITTVIAAVAVLLNPIAAGSIGGFIFQYSRERMSYEIKLQKKLGMSVRDASFYDLLMLDPNKIRSQGNKEDLLIVAAVAAATFVGSLFLPW